MRILNPVGIFKKLLIKLGNILKQIRTKKKVVSYSSFIPGSIYHISYKSRSMIVLCVTNKRTGPSSSQFISTRNNKLLSCFAIDELPAETIKDILLYLNEHQGTSYYDLDSYITGLIGRQAYYTPKLQDIRALYELDIILQDEEYEDD